jgi:simple sugar transport system ATP-binding protein
MSLQPHDDSVNAAAPAPVSGGSGSKPTIEARGIEKTFGHVRALRGVDLAVYAGEIVALVGDNGAGKSTLVNVFSGAVQPDVGEIRLDDVPVRLPDPSSARQHGIETVYQVLALSPEMSAAENLYLGRELRRPGLIGRMGFVDAPRMEREAARRFEDLGVPLPSVSVPVSGLSGGQRQTVAVARAATFTGRVVFLDEPTAALAVDPARKVMDLVRRIAAQGVSVVLITHDLPRAFEVADRVVVLRLGRVVGSVAPEAAAMETVVSMMTGATS